MNYILLDDKLSRENLKPFTFTRPVADIRIGILTIREKWEKYIGASISSLTEKYLSQKFPLIAAKENILINGSVLPDEILIKEIGNLKVGEKLISKDTLIAIHLGGELVRDLNKVEDAKAKSAKKYSSPIVKLNNLWDIFLKNEEAINADFALITKGRKSQPVSKSNHIIGKGKIFLEKGAKVEGAYLNAGGGAIYIGKNAEVMEGSLIRGSFSLGERSTLKLGTKIYGGTTIGPHCKVGGEVSNAVFFGYSNKAHDGFIGNSVIGEWCNLGAGTNNSNLKNNYSKVKLWNYHKEDFVGTGLTFCGLMLGDHSKCSISSMFNTGTVVGVNANVFGGGFPPKIIPSFSWGGSDGFTTFRIEDALEVAGKVLERRNMKLESADKDILRTLFDLTVKHRV